MTQEIFAILGGLANFWVVARHKGWITWPDVKINGD
jgi:hypothetical protein